MDRTTLVAAATLALGTLAAGCGGATPAPAATPSDAPEQVVNGQASCGVPSDEETRGRPAQQQPAP